MQVYLQKHTAKAPKPTGIIGVQHRTLMEPGIGRSGFQETGSRGVIVVSLFLSLSETVPSLVSAFFSVFWPLISVL